MTVSRASPTRPTIAPRCTAPHHRGLSATHKEHVHPWNHDIAFVAWKRKHRKISESVPSFEHAVKSSRSHEFCKPDRNAKPWKKAAFASASSVEKKKRFLQSQGLSYAEIERVIQLSNFELL